MNHLIPATLIALAALPSWASAASPAQEAVNEILASYLPSPSAFGLPQAESIDIDTKKKNINIHCSQPTAYLPLTIAEVDEIKNRISQYFGKEYPRYTISILSGGKSLDQLALFAPKRYIAPKETKTFVKRLDAPSAPLGLDGANIALWQSHGLYYQGKDDWGWQRPRLFQTCEDLFTQSFVLPFLSPMLQNAGAYVLSPKERDTSASEYIIDGDSPSEQSPQASASPRSGAPRYSETSGKKTWSHSPAPGFAHPTAAITDSINPFRTGSARMAKCVKNTDEASTAGWTADIERPGTYAVYVSYQSLPNSADDATYTVNAANGPHRVRVNQRMGGGTWVYLGHFPFSAGVADVPLVTLSNLSAHKDAVVTADAVKIGGGMGNVARKPSAPSKDGMKYPYATSGYPRFTEGARYWLQWAGAPDSVYSPSHFENDYTDDYRSRGLWVNWLAGGSSVLPSQPGLGIPVDLAFAFHSDAGTTQSDSIIGTLGIYCTDDKESYANGTSRLAARDLTNSVMTSIVDDVRRLYEPTWTRRGMWDRNYAEARVAQVPTMLLELLSHQNFADMRYGLDPTFRFTVSRAIYKGMLRYIAHRDGREYIVQPLPPCSFAISGDNASGSYTLSWQETADPLEHTATPKYYIIEHRLAGAPGFEPIATTTAPVYTLHVADTDVHLYRIVAANDGGVSFPSEALALRHCPGAAQVTVVNGFTRISGPDNFDYGDVAGFYDRRDPGVPYMQDIAYTGEQFEFRRSIPWASNETAGFGASRADFEDKTITGNTLGGLVEAHAQAIAHCGYALVSASAEAFAHATDTPEIIDLIFGNQKEIAVGTGRYDTKYKTFTPQLQRRLSTLAEKGTDMLVSGSYIATDLWCNPFSNDSTALADQEFAKSVLGYTWVSGSATACGELTPALNPYGLLSGPDLKFFNTISAESLAEAPAISPGAIRPAQPQGYTVLKYADNNLPAATATVSPTHRTVAVGIPLSSIYSQPLTSLMKEILGFLSKQENTK